jgi:hypothetical protein
MPEPRFRPGDRVIANGFPVPRGRYVAIVLTANPTDGPWYYETTPEEATTPLGQFTYREDELESADA